MRDRTGNAKDISERDFQNNCMTDFKKKKIEGRERSLQASRTESYLQEGKIGLVFFLMYFPTSGNVLELLLSLEMTLIDIVAEQDKLPFFF